MLNTVLAILTCLSFALTLWRWAVSRRFPLHRRLTTSAPLPAVTLLKPLKGVEPDTKRCLRSWITQHYPAPMQILFGTASKDDPVCDVVRELLAEFPQVDAQFIICDQALAANRKVSILIQLESHIHHPVTVISDADVSVPADFLANTTPLMSEPKVGLVNCFYRLANPSTLAMQWEAVAVNADFWSQVLQAQSMQEIDFALGAVMIVSKTQLQRLGGFCALAPYLADDYQLGQQVFRNDGRIVFSPVVVDCWESSLTWKQAWDHQLRWARTIRVCRPFPFFLSVLSNATLWPLLWLLSYLVLNWKIMAFAVMQSADLNVVFTTPLSVWTICGSCLLFRIATALELQRRLTLSNTSAAYWWLIPTKDLLNVVIWALSFLGNEIEWRGEQYRVAPGGKLTKV